MNPEENKIPDNLPTNDPSTPNDDLHAEGIDIVGSSMALDNEFMKPEAHSDTPKEEDTDQAPSAEPAVNLDEEKSIDEEKIPKNDPIIYSKRPIMPQMPSDEVPSPVPPPVPQKPTTPPPPPPKPAPKPVTEAHKESFKNDPSIKPLRTFKTDAEEAVRYSNVSKIDMVVAEQKKRDKTPIQYAEKKASPGLYIAFVLLIIVLLGGGWYFWFSSTQSNQTTTNSAPVFSGKTIIPYSKVGLVVIGEGDPISLISQKLVGDSAGIGNVYAVIPVDSASSASPSALSTVMANTHIPSRLLRSLSDEYMMGIYSYDVQSPFVILKDTFYQNAYSGMLDWENDLGSDLAPLIHIAHPNESPASIGTATWNDIVISNIDVRALRNGSGDTLLAYAFADKDTIVIAATENSLKYLLDRILQVRTIQ